MKLLRCHIDNFGVFHDYDMEFSDGLNVIMQENGWGKSTLTAFLKAMLYGFDSRRTRDITENERRRYIPWQGGKFSGTLDFEANGKQYRIQRSFGEVPRNDRCRVTELATGLPCPQTGNSVGEWLFHLDSEAFKRSVYIADTVFDAAKGRSGLHTRLNAVVSEANDIGKYDAAIAMLEQRRKFYEKTGNRGEIAEISNKIVAYQQEKRSFESMIHEISQIRSHMETLKAHLQSIEEKIAVVRKEIAEEEARNQSIRATMKVYSEMQQQMKAIEKKLHTLLEQAGGSIPDGAVLAETEKLLLAYDQLNERIQSNMKELNAVQTAISEIKERYNGSVPESKVIRDIRDAAKKIQHHRADMEAQKKSLAASGGMNARIQEYAREHPAYIDECNEVLRSWPDMEKLREKKRTLELRIPYEEKLWQERKNQYSALAGAVDSADRSVKQLRNRRKLSFVDAHKQLEEYIEAIARIELEEKQLQGDYDRKERDELEILFGNNIPRPEEIEALQADVERAAQLSREASEAETLLHEEEQKYQKLCERFNNLKNAHDVKAIPEAKAPKTQMLIGVLLVVAALIAAVVGIYLKDSAMVFFCIAVICGIGGAIMLVLYGKKQKEFGIQMQQLAEMRAAQESELAEAETECNAQCDLCRDLTERLTAQKEKISQNQRSAHEYLRRWFPDLLLGEEQRYLAILRRQLSRWNDLNAAYAQRCAMAESISQKRRAAEQAAEVIFEAYPEIRSMPLSEAIAKLSRMQTESDMAKTRLVEARKDLLRFLQDSAKTQSLEAESETVCNEVDLSRVRTQIDDANMLKRVATVINALNAQSSDNLRKIKDEIQEINDLLHKQLKRLKDCLLPLDLLVETIDDMPSGIKQMDRFLRGYNEHFQATAERERHIKALQAEVIRAEQALEKCLQEYGINSEPEMLEEMLNRAEQDCQSEERLRWTEQRIGKDLKSDSTALEEIRKQIDARLIPFADSADKSPRDILSRLQEYADNGARLLNEQRTMKQQIEKFAEEHHIDSSIQTVTQEEAPVHPNQQRMLVELQQSRDTLLQEKAQCGERIRQINASLERYPFVEQNLKLLYANRRAATENLFAVQQSMRLLKHAKDSLAERYLGHIEKYFNAYLELWLGSDAVSGSIDANFHVVLHEDNKEHDMEGYSTGYCDIIDLCMRMALIRTLFEKEQPFVIMDDPFVNLDQSRLSNALGFIQSFAKEYQVIYFTCHPVRTLNAELLQAEVTTAKLALKTLPVCKKEKTIATETRVEKETYRIVTGKKGIVPAGVQRRITNNIFTLRFEQEDATDQSENQYEVFFVDEKERILSDRQIVEAAFGQLTPSAVRFCLSTREDSGKAYSLIIRNTVLPEGDVLKKIPYEAAIAFAVDFEF